MKWRDHTPSNPQHVCNYVNYCPAGWLVQFLLKAKPTPPHDECGSDIEFLIY